ncbi:uncharacterized protein T551_00273 [Pneumocystis jirovecii RU7]|uniref:40S ribosomal protein S7 n=1 Tax=Pneumocystis jirovecii (strain RU7) TaxID=1408657 RepID=A0A0W4ZWQ2_PNEJ7|nr:uncharacterized protein T551_00273 [Pneumocystis jirovecii RU7]KTW32788.1 hypothetical protein T551_00273 [Pneumocystis jirovecii RU7]
MSVARKIIKPEGVPVTDLERTVAQALFDLETVPDLKRDLRLLQIVGAREFDVGRGKKAIVIFIFPSLLKAFHKIQLRLVRELEKKFSDRHVVFVAQRRILPKPSRKNRQKQRLRSRTLTSVHEKILEDLVFPAEIVGKRIRVCLDGKKIMKVFLDNKDASSIDYKLDSLQCVYSKLTSRNVVFSIQEAGL